jgi:hypothetical protein
MSLIPPGCVEWSDTRSICIADEKGKKYVLTNNAGVTVRKVKIDKCLPQKVGEKRCDFMMDSEVLKRVIFIELKGGDLNKAVNQIYSTIIYLKDEFDGYRIDARIVGTKDVPAFRNTPDYKKLAGKVIPTNGTIERATNKIYTESI